MKTKRLSADGSILIPFFLLILRSPIMDILLFLGAVLLHETGHLAALYRYGYPPKRISFSCLGAKMETGESYIPYKKEAAIYLSGPAAGLFGCLLAFFLLRWHFTKAGMLFFSFNLLLTLFNLLPIKGLDGGEALFSLLCLRGEEATAQKISEAIHSISLLLLFTFSLYVLKRENNPSLLILTLSFALGSSEKRKKATKAS
ncbi:MAG: site-2 protease family protein [Clostridia bacterium]|nr:site-2 protease family protein [Clostridia bacterium]